MQGCAGEKIISEMFGFLLKHFGLLQNPLMFHVKRHLHFFLILHEAKSSDDGCIHTHLCLSMHTRMHECMHKYIDPNPMPAYSEVILFSGTYTKERVDRISATLKCISPFLSMTFFNIPQCFSVFVQVRISSSVTFRLGGQLNWEALICLNIE